MSDHENTPAVDGPSRRFPPLSPLDIVGYLVLIGIAVAVRVNDWSRWTIVPLILALIVWRPLRRKLFPSR